MSTAIVWFRRDLRLQDNPALDAAVHAHDRVLCAYVYAPDEEAPWQPGAASRWWLHHSLAALDTQLRERGAALHIRHGPSLGALRRLIEATGAQAVYWNRLYEPAATARDTHVKQVLRERGLSVHRFNAGLLADPWRVATAQGNPYRVFTPFWRNLRAGLQPRPPIPAPGNIPAPTPSGGLHVDALQLLPSGSWDAEFPVHWNPGEAGAGELARRLCETVISDYAANCDRPDRDATSRLSPHLHFGEIGPAQLLWLLSGCACERGDERTRTAIEPFLRELGWREFSVHLLYHFPQTPQQNLNRQFDVFDWAAHDGKALRRWQQGRSGVPIVDAGMRQLWRSGWMHNRVRMIVASFLTKNLRQHWLHGARWFWDTLIDADLANNTQGWQWTAGCGADAAPYFRIFNPISQGERFDPDGSYVRRWVTELRDVPAPLIHQPWKQPGLAAGCGYPEPLVDLRASREAALAAYRRMRADCG